MPLTLKEKPVPKDVKASIPEDLLKALEAYVKASMEASKYPEAASQDARDQVVTVAIAKLIAGDKDFAEKNKESATTARHYSVTKKSGAAKK